MRLMRKSILPLTFFLCLYWTSISYASLVTVDVAGKTAKSDVASINPSVRFAGDQIGIFVKSIIPEPQIFTIKINGLKDQVYDVYINQEFKGAKAANEFEAGVEYRVDGRVADPSMIKCLSAVKDSAGEAYTRLHKSGGPEAQRVCYTLNTAKGWAQSALQRDQAFRSIGVILAPSGIQMQKMIWLTRESDYETARAVTRSCWLIQQARDRMFHEIKDPRLRNEAVVAMTPVEFATDYSILNGKQHITAKLLNNCDLPVSGAISMALPKGWKTTAKKLSFNGLKSGETFNLSFDLIPPSKTTTPPDSVPIAASVTITQDIMTASMKLNITAAKTGYTPGKQGGIK